MYSGGHLPGMVSYAELIENCYGLTGIKTILVVLIHVSKLRLDLEDRRCFFLNPSNFC